MPTKITLRLNGPVLVDGDFEIFDAQGNRVEHEAGKNVALCRCGQSGKKPFCDGSHKACGFVAP